MKAASFRAVGATQKEAAIQAGIGERTLQGWEGADWWPEAMAEAVKTHHADLQAFALRTLRKAVQDDNDVRAATWILERMQPKTFGQRVDVTSGGERIEVQVVVPSPVRGGT